jgi:hypothetical protein
MRPLKPKLWWDPGKSIPGRDFPDLDRYGHRKAVCRRCHLVMSDSEPGFTHGEFYHGAKPHQTRAMACVNNGKTFDQRHAEIEPFLRKSRRRALKRAGIRA